jgi:hypothetical protein
LETLGLGAAAIWNCTSTIGNTTVGVLKGDGPQPVVYGPSEISFGDIENATFRILRFTALFDYVVLDKFSALAVDNP